MKVPQAWSPRSCSSRKYCIVNITLQPTLSQAAKDVVLAPKPVISDDTSGLEPAVLQQLLAQIGSLASVYHKPADSFVSRQRLAVARAEELQVRVKGFAFVCCVFVCAGGGGSNLAAAPLLAAAGSFVRRGTADGGRVRLLRVTCRPCLLSYSGPGLVSASEASWWHTTLLTVI